MSDVIKQVSVPKEFDDVMGAVVDLVLAAKWGKLNLAQQLGSFLPLLGEFSALPVEVNGEPEACADAAALQIRRLVSGLLKNPF